MIHASTLKTFFIQLFKSNGLTPEPNDFREDWVDEYHKIKGSHIMRGIKVCLMQDGTYSVVNSGIPLTYFANNRGLTESYACKLAVNYYRNRIKHKRATTPVAEV
jgi:hypothetical protein